MYQTILLVVMLLLAVLCAWSLNRSQEDYRKLEPSKRNKRVEFNSALQVFISIITVFGLFAAYLLVCLMGALNAGATASEAVHFITSQSNVLTILVAVYVCSYVAFAIIDMHKLLKEIKAEKAAQSEK